ncbi:MAG: glycosyltransferase [Gemmatimonadaceae bacterium]
MISGTSVGSNFDVASARIAIVHEWLVVPGGSELILKEMISVFPKADVFCLVDKLSDADREALGVGRPHTSFLQHIPGIARHYRSMLPLMTMAVESLDLSAYDVVISNSHAVAKGVEVRSDALHVCNCCSPMRYAWDLRAQYLAEANLDSGVKGWMANKLLDRLKIWDANVSRRVDDFISISDFIAQRVQRSYGRESTIIYPPVDTNFFTVADSPRNDTYVAVSRLVSYKRMTSIVEAFRELQDRHLIVIGDGPERDRVRAAAGANVTLMGWQTREVIREQLRKARAVIFAAEEDFGILPVEAQACGTPVIAFGVGGSLETVHANGPNRTGMFFDDASPAGIAAAIRAFETQEAPTVNACRLNAERFSVNRFQNEFRAFVIEAWKRHQAARDRT